MEIKKILKSALIIIMLLGLLGCTNAKKELITEVKSDVLQISEIAGLQDVEIKVEKRSSGGYSVDIISSNFDLLSPELMIDFDTIIENMIERKYNQGAELENRFHISNYICGNDKYLIWVDAEKPLSKDENRYERTILKNYEIYFHDYVYLNND